MSENAHEAKMAHPRMAAGVLFFDDEARVMMLETTYKDYRDIPGGYVETGESPLAACLREVYEELALDVPIGRLLAIDWAPSAREGDKVLYLFDGGILSQVDQQHIRLQSDEIASYGFFPVSEIEDLTIPRLSRRVRAAVSARESGTTAYLEHGEAP
ncbi:NUDIX hydrolase [Streptomyces sp. NPDC051994]|uniref:NUDIX hydrolase n=1 Tax=unclassified Streptomyces TaxID=2593676 RepID=UPI00341CAC63